MNFYNKQSKRYNNEKQAISNGLFRNPSQFEWHSDDGLHLMPNNKG
jgi:hypothetical protein